MRHSLSKMSLHMGYWSKQEIHKSRAVQLLFILLMLVLEFLGSYPTLNLALPPVSISKRTVQSSVISPIVWMILVLKTAGSFEPHWLKYLEALCTRQWTTLAGTMSKGAGRRQFGERLGEWSGWIGGSSGISGVNFDDSNISKILSLLFITRHTLLHLLVCPYNPE